MAYTVIQKLTAGAGGATEFDFTNISQTYKDLAIWVSAKSDYTSVVESIFIAINGNTSNIYTQNGYQATGLNTWSNFELTPATNFNFIGITGTTGGNWGSPNLLGGGVFYFPNYANTSTNKQALGQSGALGIGGTKPWFQRHGTARYDTTSAISRITVYGLDNSPPYPGSFKWLQYSSATLFGIK